jgi:hypothetical protein
MPISVILCKKCKKLRFHRLPSETGAWSFSAWGMSKRGVDLAGRLEKTVGPLGTGLGDQGQNKYRY